MKAPSIVLLGPQKLDLDPEVGRVLKELGVRGRVSLVTAGWQERESEDEALIGKLGVKAVNLRLHKRSEEVFAKDAELKKAYETRQKLLRHLQAFYRLRLDYADDAASAIAVRHVEPELLEQEWNVSVEQFRQLDRDHMERCGAIHAAFEERWRPGEREVIARHRREITAQLESTSALIVAGGHIASLLNRMKLFDVISLAAGRHVIAWSAGAMVLTDRIVLFHDFPPYGKDVAQVLDAGFGLAPGLVVLPDPRRRVRMDDVASISRFAQRMAPSTVVAMDQGAKVVLKAGRISRASVERLAPTGEVDRGWKG